MNPKEWIQNLFAGLVRAGGDASPQVVMVKAPNGTESIALVREGYSVQRLPGLSKLQVTHTFSDLESLADWLVREAEPKSAQIVVGPTQVVAAAVPHDAVSDRVSCKFDGDPELAVWRAKLGRVIGQKDLVNLLRATPRILGEATGRDGSSLGGAAEIVAAEVRKLEVARSADVKVEIGANGEIAFQALTDTTSVKGRLPSSLILTTPILRGVRRPGDHDDLSADPRTWPIATYDIEVLVELEVVDKVAKLTLVAPRLPVYEVEAVADAAAYLRALLAFGGGEWLVGCGAFDTDTYVEVDPA